MNSVIGQAVDDFNRDIANTTSTSSYTSGSGGIQMINSSKISLAKRSGSQNKDNNIFNVLQKAELSNKARGGRLPALEPI